MDGAGIKPEQPEPMPGLEPASAPSNDQKANLHDERPRYKSYRKKYRKMKLGFDQLMEEANELFVSERRASEIAKRIQEQNDQLLDVLLEINSSKHMPPSKRFDLSTARYAPSSLPQPRRHNQPGMAPPEKALAHLENLIPHTPADVSDLSTLTADYQPTVSGWPGYMTMEQEEAYMAAMDDRASVEDEALDAKAIDSKPTRSLVTERDFAVQNPVSVHNWLRKHQPQVFDGKDKDSDKGGKSPPPSRRKKGAKPEPTEALDDEGDGDSVVLGSIKSKRKRDDEAYRPKGGHTRPSKRKRERDDVDIKGGKKSRKSNGVEDES